MRRIQSITRTAECRAPATFAPYAPYSRLYSMNSTSISINFPNGMSRRRRKLQFLDPEFQAALRAPRQTRQVDCRRRCNGQTHHAQYQPPHIHRRAYGGEEPHSPATSGAPRGALERFIQSEGTPLELYAAFQTLEGVRRLN